MKKESIKNEIRAIWSGFKAWLYIQDQKKEADRKAAGIRNKEEQRADRAEWAGVCYDERGQE